jgi:hypothetical protein
MDRLKIFKFLNIITQITNRLNERKEPFFFLPVSQFLEKITKHEVVSLLVIAFKKIEKLRDPPKKKMFMVFGSSLFKKFTTVSFRA